MMNIGSRSRSRRAVEGAALALPLAFALTACSGNSPANTSAASPTPAAAKSATPAAAAAPQRETTGEAVNIPKYVAADNVRKDVSTKGCMQVGRQGWRLSGTATNTSSSSRAYSIVVDFVTAKGDTVLNTKVLSVGPVAPKSAANWSATGAAGQQKVACVIRQALAKS
jgi:hypothetical protein